MKKKCVSFFYVQYMDLKRRVQKQDYRWASFAWKMGANLGERLMENGYM